jgi:hypothetical protein
MLGWIAAIVLFIPAALLVILLFPALLINEAMLQRAAGWVAAEDGTVAIAWSEATVNHGRPYFLGRSIRVSVRDLRIELGERGSVSERRAEFGLTYDLRRLLPRLREIGPLHLEGGRIVMRTAGDDAQAGKSPGGGGIALPRWLRRARLGEIVIGDQHWALDAGGTRVTGVMRARGRSVSGMGSGPGSLLGSASGGYAIDTRIEHRLASGPLQHSGWNELSAASRAPLLGSSWRVLLRGQAAGEGLGEGEHELSARLSGDRTRWHHRIDWRHPRVRVRAGIDGDWSEALRASIDLEVQPVSADQRERALVSPALQARDCRLVWRAAGERQSLDADCPLALGDARDAAALFAGRLRVGLSGVWPWDAAAPLDVRADLMPRSLAMARAEGGIHLAGSLVPANPERSPPPSLDVEVRAAIDDFRRLVDRLSGSAWAVPAPFHVLRGPLRLRLSGGGELPHARISAHLETRLRAPHQRLDLDFDARLKSLSTVWPPQGPLRASLQANLLLRDVALQLPPIEGAMPGIVPDGRIQPDLANAREAGGQALKYEVRVRSGAGHSIAIGAPVSGEMIPLSAELTASSAAPLRGWIGIGSFPLEVAGFEREVEGGRLMLHLSEVTEQARGELSFDAGGRTLDLSLAEISGLTSPLPEPKPPLAIGQIVGSLLTGRAIDVAVTQVAGGDAADAASREQPVSLEFQYRF